MFNAIDATKLNKGPLINNQIEVFAFFICFVIVLSFFFMNIFVGLIILTFQEQGNSEEEGTELDRNQVGSVDNCAKDGVPGEAFSFRKFLSSFSQLP